MSDGRSPLRDRQLHDLRLLPTATDPRPTFFWSAEGSRDTVITHSEFPKLLWSDTGVEITVRSKEEQDSKIAQGYVFVAPASVVVDPLADLSDALAGLSDEERTLVLEAQQAQRRAEITAKLAGLSPEALEKLLAGATEPAKKRGRPAKVA